MLIMMPMTLDIGLYFGLLPRLVIFHLEQCYFIQVIYLAIQMITLSRNVMLIEIREKDVKEKYRVILDMIQCWNQFEKRYFQQKKF